MQGVLANVLRPFVSGDRVVEFIPRGPEDEDAAEQETDYVNFVALERNNGFVTLYGGMWDALTVRNGYVKCNWRVRQDIVIEPYFGQSEDQLAMLLDDKDVEPVEPPNEYPGPDGQMLYDIKVRRVRPTEYCETVPVPPDEVLVSVRLREPSTQDADFCQHRTVVTVSDLREMGYDVPDDIGTGPDNDVGQTQEDFARELFASQSDLNDDETQDPARRLVMYRESWLRIDRDGDGIAELRRVCMVGQTILADEEADIIPIATFCGSLMPHQHLGSSVYDQIKDLAELKTALLRTYMDSTYLATRPRTYVNMDADVSLDDLMTSRPGGVIRGHGPAEAAISVIQSPDVGASAISALEYLDNVRGSRTGYNDAVEGMKPSLATGTLGEMQMQVSQSQLRLEMISRTIAETGVKDLFRIIHAMTLKHANKEEKVRLRNKWVTVNPREWVRRTDLQISVGLGNVSQAQKTQGLMLLGQAQEKAAPMGLVTPENVYNLGAQLAQAQGFKNPDAFFTRPPEKPKIDPQTGQPVIGPDGKPEMESVPPPQPPNPLVQAEQIKAQANTQIAQMKAQSDGAIQQARAQADMQVQQHKIQTDAQLDLAKHEMQLKFDDFRHQREQQTQIQIANIKAAAQVESAKISAKMGFDQAVLQSEMQGSQSGD